ncbi:MAG TPA: hypothetical protein VGO61_03085 [Steroidobacteraceae bacterium]|jgi:hypothetical protein|nr:hypothetical protein [Steroidobacteraceae bacterium]
MACSQCAGAHEQYEVASTLERLRYFPRQLLTADDMRVEQEYFREKQRRHNRFLHGWGVVCGLEVRQASTDAGTMKVSVCAGYALGPWGDEIYVEEPAPLDLTHCARPPGDPCLPSTVVAAVAVAPKLLVKIRYVECPSRPMRTLPAGCGCDETACEYSRTRDGFEVRCFVKPQILVLPPVVQVDAAVPACIAPSPDPWVLLAEVESVAAGLDIKNTVRRVVRNTPSLAGM